VNQRERVVQWKHFTEAHHQWKHGVGLCDVCGENLCYMYVMEVVDRETQAILVVHARGCYDPARYESV
jgi:hypothetical protein